VANQRYRDIEGRGPAPDERASNERGRLTIAGATDRLRIRLVPGHCDPTVNLYDWYVGIRNNRVEQLWPITARGAVY
jgi:D-serine deaminase-like pyridoxal phosphate-dependent protein